MDIRNETVRNDKDLTEYTKEELVAKCLQQEEKITDLENKVNWMTEQILLGKHKEFGTSSEKTDSEQLSLFNEAEKEANPKAAEPTFEEITYKRKTQTGRRDELLADLPVEVVEYTLPEEEQVCTVV